MTNAKQNKTTIALLLVAVLLTACSGQYKAVSHAALLDYADRPTYGNLQQLAAAYATTANEAAKVDTAHPGLMAEYGVALAMLGEEEEANRMFNREMYTFPQSRRYVMALKRRLVPDFAADTLSFGPADTINLAIIASLSLDTITAERTVPHCGSIIDSTDTVRLRLQTPTDSVEAPLRLTANQKREQLAEQQQAAADLKKKQDEEKIQAKKDRENSKKEAKKLKEKQQKEKKKQQKAQQKQRKKENDRLSKLREAEKKAAQEAREAEKKAAQEAREAEKKAAQEAREAEKKAAQEAREAEKKAAQEAREAEKKAAQEAREAEKKAAQEAREAEKKAAQEAREAEKKAAQEAREAEKKEKTKQTPNQ